MRASIFLSKRYSLFLCYLLLYIDSFDDVVLNLEKIYAIWLKSRPSKTTFATLISDMDDLGWIDKQEGAKRSSFVLKIKRKKILDALQMKPSFNFKRSWIYEEGLFDFEAMEAIGVKGAVKGSRMSKRWTLQEELNRFLYPD